MEEKNVVYRSCENRNEGELKGKDDIIIFYVRLTNYRVGQLQYFADKFRKEGFSQFVAHGCCHPHGCNTEDKIRDAKAAGIPLITAAEGSKYLDGKFVGEELSADMIREESKKSHDLSEILHSLENQGKVKIHYDPNGPENFEDIGFMKVRKP